MDNQKTIFDRTEFFRTNAPPELDWRRWGTERGNTCWIHPDFIGAKICECYPNSDMATTGRANCPYYLSGELWFGAFRTLREIKQEVQASWKSPARIEWIIECLREKLDYAQSAKRYPNKKRAIETCRAWIEQAEHHLKCIKAAKSPR